MRYEHLFDGMLLKTLDINQPSFRRKKCEENDKLTLSKTDQ